MKAMAKDPDDRYRSAEELGRTSSGSPTADRSRPAIPASPPCMTAVGATQVVATSTGRTMAIACRRPAPAPPSREDGERKKRTRRLVILLVVLLVALGVIAFFLLRSLGSHVTVPNVVGSTQSVATQTLKNDNLTVGTATFRTSTQARGIVLSTKPAAGASVSKNSAVESRGQRRAEHPHRHRARREGGTADGGRSRPSRVPV